MPPTTRTFRRRLIAYGAALFLNLAIVSGSLTITEVEHPPIVRLRRRVSHPGCFSPGELLNNGAVITLPVRVHRTDFDAN